MSPFHLWKIHNKDEGYEGWFQLQLTIFYPRTRNERLAQQEDDTKKALKALKWWAVCHAVGGALDRHSSMKGQHVFNEL